MNTSEMLSLELTFEPDGHLTDVALTALADGQDAIVPEHASKHLDECQQCVWRLGELALLAVDVGMVLREVPTQQQPRAQAVFPVYALAAALAVALVGAIPLLAHAWAELVSTAAVIVRIAPHLARSAAALAQAGTSSFGPGGLLALALSCMVLLMTAFAIAKTLPSRVPAQGGL